MRSGPVVKDVVLVGAGHAHVAVLRSFGMRPIAGVRLTLLTREVETPYSGMLPGVVAGHYRADEAQIDAGRLARFAGARLYQDEAVGLDLAGRRVLCRGRPAVAYDVLSLDIGSRPNTGGVPGAAEHCIPVKPIDGFLERFEGVLARVRAGRSRHVLVVGGGAGGVELLLAVERRLRAEADGVRFTLVAGSAVLLPGFARGVGARFAAVMAGRGVEVVTGVRVVSVAAGAVRLEDGRRIAADEILWTTEAAPAGWLAETGLPVADGFVRVDATLLAAAGVFAAGDMVAFGPGAIPRSGVYAVRAGPVLAANIRAVLTGGRLRRYRPQKRALAILTEGGREAVATRNGVAVGGAWAWRLKDWIDRRWMARYQDLPEMAAEQAAASPLADKAALRDVADVAMRCGGCGAKVGATVLERALGRIRPAERTDVVVGLEAPDDAAVVDGGGPMLSVHTVDHFRAMIDDPYRFGMIAANHALGDVYAMGATPTTALAIATVPYGLARKVEAELSDMMQGANEILREAGCALVGGHSGEGAELSLGFAVNGLCGREGLLRKGGLRAGDALVLTKAVGTGTLLAADMRGKARVRWVQAAVRQMIQSNGPAAAILARHGVRAATDVTGFGLLGHLREMTEASGVDAAVTLSAVPVLEGAAAMAAAGWVSSLQGENLGRRGAAEDPAAVRGMASYPLLFDPQTAGGLLAGVPAAAAAGCVAALRAAGFEGAAVIGVVTARGNGLVRVVG